MMSKQKIDFHYWEHILDNVLDGATDTMVLEPLWHIFKEEAATQTLIGKDVTDGIETRTILNVYEVTLIQDEFTPDPKFVTTTVYALSPAKDKTHGQYMLTNCDPLHWELV